MDRRLDYFTAEYGDKTEAYLRRMIRQFRKRIDEIEAPHIKDTLEMLLYEYCIMLELYRLPFRQLSLF